MSEFTPGPWELSGKTIYALQHHGWRKGVEEFCNRFSAHVQGFQCPEVEQAANARLMAAAPELLEALIRLLDNDDETLTLLGRRNLARAAIAKATGINTPVAESAL